MRSSVLLLSFFFIIGLIQADEKEIKSHDYAIILAGGNGQRLWPLSRKKCPKQLLTIENNKTLLEQAIDRISPLIPHENIWISTTKQHKKSVAACVSSLVGKIVIEPAMRNTGPAILLTCLKLYQHDEHARVIFLPADPYIPTHENNAFVQFLGRGLNFVNQKDHLLLFGVQPSYPATGYGYIEFDQNDILSTNAPYKITKFREKPSPYVAQHYIESNNMLWNIGMFCGKVSVFIEEFKKVSPEMYKTVAAHFFDGKAYENVKEDSIDYAVMERSDNVWVLPVDFVWCDVGNIAVLLSLKELESNVISVDAHNNMVDVKHKLIALVGVNNLCVVETEDALLITKQAQAEKVRGVVQQLMEGKHEKYL